MSKLYISMYHYTRDLVHSRYPQIKGLDINLFEKQLEFFDSLFNVVTMEEVIEAIDGYRELPQDALLLTFDDGYIDNYTVALPILEKYGMQGSFFIPGKTFTEHKLLDVNKIHFILASGDSKAISQRLKQRMEYYRGAEFDFPPVEEMYAKYSEGSRYDDYDTIFIKQMLQTALPEKLRSIISSELLEEYVGIPEEVLAYELYMTEDQLATMKRHGMHIGLHGYDHYWLGNLEIADMKTDIDKALDVMSTFIDKDRWVMNYPYGSYNDEVIRYISEKGAVIGLTTEVRFADLLNDDRMLLPRYDCNDFPPKSENYRNT